MKRRKITYGIIGIILLIVLFAFTPPPVRTFRDSIKVNAKPDKVWQIISDVGNYDQYATGLHSVDVMEGDGLGMVRSCTDSNGSWTEMCTIWEPNHRYAFEVDTNSEDYPYPFKSLKGIWSIQSKGDESEIFVEFQFQLDYRWMDVLYGKAVMEAFEKGDVLENWSKAIQNLKK